ncbi:hypothetical protein R1sor_018365 [Riccia sorocarpa]|uniref:Peptidase A1 domain-containing protein n=1 Tax=Riccia sorocarpa TaxID=122646 RepID=A0ABD3I9G8_9MARC
MLEAAHPLHAARVENVGLRRPRALPVVDASLPRQSSTQRLAVSTREFDVANVLDPGLYNRMQLESWARTAFLKETIGIPVRASSRKLRGFKGGSLLFPVVRVRELYGAEIQVGTPAQKLLLEMDTGSDLTWIKCRRGSKSSRKVRQYGDELVFDPQRSSTFESFNSATLFKRSPNKTFYVQCISSYKSVSLDNTGLREFELGEFGTGIFGLGRGMLSLPVQIGSHYSHRFAYCLSSEMGYNSSFLRFGDSASPTASEFPGIKHMSLILNPKHRSFYYLRLESLSVCGEQLRLPKTIFSIDENSGTGGVILDTGTTYTFLPPAVYEKLVEVFSNQTPLQRATQSSKLALCFNITGSEDPTGIWIPKMVLHFREGNELVDIELPPENYIQRVSSDKVCITVLPW